MTDEIIMKKEFINSLRFLMVLPVAVLCYYIGYISFMWCSNNHFFGIKFFDYVLEIIGCGFASGCFVAAGTAMAPRYRKVVAIVLSTLGCIAGVVVIVLDLYVWKGKIDWLVLASLAAHIIGAIVGAYYIIDEMPEEDNQEKDATTRESIMTWIAIIIGVVITSFAITKYISYLGKVERREPVNNSQQKDIVIGQYVYIDYARVLHTKQGCRAVYKDHNMQVVNPVRPDELTEWNLSRVCSQCVAPEQIEELRRIINNN